MDEDSAAAMGDGTDRANTRGVLATTDASLNRILVRPTTEGMSEATQRDVAAMDTDADGNVSTEEVLAYVRRSMSIKKSLIEAPSVEVPG